MPADPRQPAPLQFRLRAMLIITALVAVLFSLLGWLGVSERARMVILVVLAASVSAAVGLLYVIAGSVSGNGDDRDP